MNFLNYRQLDLPMAVEETAPRPVKSSVIDVCVRLVSQNGLRYYRWNRGNRWAVCFELPIHKGRLKPMVCLEDIMRRRELSLTSFNTDVALDKGEREAVESVKYLWREEHPQNKCQILFRSEYVRIRKRVPYNLLEEKPLFERRLIEGIVGIRQAMEYIFPLAAKNITFIHRAPSSWPHAKRLEIS
jgi:hypothetical protein